MIALLLGWLGGTPIEYPFFQLSQILTVSYFIYFLLIINVLMSHDVNYLFSRQAASSEKVSSRFSKSGNFFVENKISSVTGLHKVSGLSSVAALFNWLEENSKQIYKKHPIIARVVFVVFLYLIFFTNYIMCFFLYTFKIAVQFPLD
jgi:hypothetical protein